LAGDKSGFGCVDEVYVSDAEIALKWRALGISTTRRSSASAILVNSAYTFSNGCQLKAYSLGNTGAVAKLTPSSRSERGMLNLDTDSDESVQREFDGVAKETWFRVFPWTRATDVPNWHAAHPLS